MIKKNKKGILHKASENMYYFAFIKQYVKVKQMNKNE